MKVKKKLQSQINQTKQLLLNISIEITRLKTLDHKEAVNQIVAMGQSLKAINCLNEIANRIL